MGLEMPESKDLPSSLVTVWPVWVILVQVTIVPTLMVSVAGLKAKLPLLSVVMVTAWPLLAVVAVGVVPAVVAVGVFPCIVFPFLQVVCPETDKGKWQTTSGLEFLFHALRLLWSSGIEASYPGSLGKDTWHGYVKEHCPRRELSFFGNRPCEKWLEAA